MLDKQAAARERGSQVIGEFLDWMSAQGCRLIGHKLYVRKLRPAASSDLLPPEEYPLWASIYLIALTSTRGLVLFCKRCDYSEDGLGVSEGTIAP